MIIKKEKKGGVTVYYVDKDYDDAKLKTVIGKKLKRSQIKNIIDDDADVYNAEGKLLLRFRKNKLNKEHVREFYDNVIQFAKSLTSNRGTSSGSDRKNLEENAKAMTNIFGYFDKLAPGQKFVLKQKGIKMPKIRGIRARELRQAEAEGEPDPIPDREHRVHHRHYERELPDRRPPRRRRRRGRVRQPGGDRRGRVFRRRNVLPAIRNRRRYPHVRRDLHGRPSSARQFTYCAENGRRQEALDSVLFAHEHLGADKGEIEGLHDAAYPENAPHHAKTEGRWRIGGSGHRSGPIFPG